MQGRSNDSDPRPRGQGRTALDGNDPLPVFLFGAAGVGEAGVATGEEAEARDNVGKEALAVTEEVTPQRDRTVKK